MKIIIEGLNHGLDTSIKIKDDQGNELPATITELAFPAGSYQVEVHEFDPIRDMIDFHTKFQLVYAGPPRTLPHELRGFRSKFMQEELDEYILHAHAAADELTRSPMFRDQANYAFHLENQLDALVDLVYVAIGTAYLQGFNFKEAWERVQAANMSKVRARRAEDSKRGSTFDVIKPPGWEPPSHIDLVEVNDLTQGDVP